MKSLDNLFKPSDLPICSSGDHPRDVNCCSPMSSPGTLELKQIQMILLWPQLIIKSRVNRVKPQADDEDDEDD